MSADDSRHDSMGADPRQGDLLELLEVMETNERQYRHARQGVAAGAGQEKPAGSS